MPEESNRFDEAYDAVRKMTDIARRDDGRVPEDGRSVFVPEQVEQITYHDFAIYETIFDPWAVRDPRQNEPADSAPPPPQETAPPPPSYLPADLKDFEDLSFEVEAAISYFLDTEVREALEDGVEFDPTPIITLLH